MFNESHVVFLRDAEWTYWRNIASFGNRNACLRRNEWQAWRILMWMPMEQTYRSNWMEKNISESWNRAVKWKTYRNIINYPKWCSKLTRDDSKCYYPHRRTIETRPSALTSAFTHNAAQGTKCTHTRFYAQCGTRKEKKMLPSTHNVAKGTKMNYYYQPLHS